MHRCAPAPRSGRSVVRDRSDNSSHNYVTYIKNRRRPAAHRAKSVQASSARARPGGGAAVAGPRPRSARLCHEIPGHTGILIRNLQYSGIFTLHDYGPVRTAGPLHTAAYAHQGRGDHRAAPRAHPPPAAAKTRVSGITPRNATHMHSARPGARAGRPVGSCGRARNAHASHAPARASALTPAGCRGITAPPRPRRASLCLSVSLSLSLSLSLSRTHSLSRLAGCATR